MSGGDPPNRRPPDGAEPARAGAAQRAQPARAEAAQRAQPARAEAPDQIPPGAPRAQSSRTAVGRHPWWTLALSVAVVLVAAGGGGVLWLDHQGTLGRPGGREVVIHVPRGGGTDDVASMLARKKVVGSSVALEAWLLLHGTPAIGNGTYVFHENESFAAVKSDLEAGPNVFSLQLPPGSSVEQVSRQVDQLPGHDGSAFLALATGGTLHSPWSPPGSSSLDGLLGAGWYQVKPGETDAQLLIQMIDRFDHIAKSSGLASGAQRMGRAPYEVITVASIVQKEAVIDKNMAPVARVIYNRLAAGLPLRSKASLRFAEHRDGGAVTPADERRATPYNTFVNPGLTPTPICSLSPAALRAALNPPRGSWRYYVVTGKDGTESFATTAAQERADEARARRHGLR